MQRQVGSNRSQSRSRPKLTQTSVLSGLASGNAAQREIAISRSAVLPARAAFPSFPGTGGAQTAPTTHFTLTTI